jgi:septal ring factor EnvC (AmiA/AmiB activator)
MTADLIHALEGLLGVMIPVLALSIGGVLLLSRSRLGEAVTRRIAGERHEPEFEAQLDGVQAEVSQLRAQLAETQDRLDFAERMLTRLDTDQVGPRSRLAPAPTPAPSNASSE